MSDTPSKWAMEIAVPFVTEQSLGEWGDEIIEADATKLALLLDRVVAEEREECAKIAEIAVKRGIRLLEELKLDPLEKEVMGLRALEAEVKTAFVISGGDLIPDSDMQAVFYPCIAKAIRERSQR